MTPFVKNVLGRGWMQNAATGSYAVAASSGSVFFALNFGDEGMYNRSLFMFQVNRV
jgi:alpha-1,3-glucan synthase